MNFPENTPADYSLLAHNRASPLPMPKTSAKTILPFGLQLFHKKGLVALDSIEHFTLIPRQKGFVPIENVDEPGGDVTITLFASAREAKMFSLGFKCAGPSDDVSFCIEEIRLPGRTVHAFLAHYADSDDDTLHFDNLIGK